MVQPLEDVLAQAERTRSDLTDLLAYLHHMADRKVQVPIAK